MKRLVLSLLAAATLAGCASLPGRHIQIPYALDTEEAARLVAPGPGEIRGSALIRQVGGGVVTCAGFPVELIPVTKYSEHRIGQLYGNSTSGFKRSENVTFDPDPADYKRLARSTVCDPQGKFEFNRVAAGEFFAIAVVVWNTGYVQQGGFMMRRIHIKPGEGPLNLVLTPDVK